MSAIGVGAGDLLGVGAGMSVDLSGKDAVSVFFCAAPTPLSPQPDVTNSGSSTSVARDIRFGVMA